MLDDSKINLWGAICSVVALGVAVVRFLWGLLQAPQGLPSISGLPRLQAILFLGLAAAAAHGLLWSLAERLFHWKFGAGGGASLPEGWQAVVLSATMTIPLVVLPPVYAQLAHSQIVLPGHLWGACAVLIAAAIGHIFLYGSKAISFRGVKNLIFPLGSAPTWPRALTMEFVYALVHFGSIVLMYRVVVGSRLGPLDARVIYSTLISAGVWFFAVCVSIFARYPDSLGDKRWIEVRGVIHALMLTVTLEGGMLMA